MKINSNLIVKIFLLFITYIIANRLIIKVVISWSAYLKGYSCAVILPL